MGANASRENDTFLHGWRCRPAPAISALAFRAAPALTLPSMVTIYEVAELAGVSPKTAARILAGEPGRPYNRERVLAAAKKLGYVRNQTAATLRSGRSGLLGVIVPDISNPFYPVFFQTIHDIAVAHGYQLLLSSTFGTLKGEILALRMFEVSRVEGIVLNAAEGESDEECDAILNRFLARGVPVILAGRPARRLKVDEIVLRNIEAVEKAVAFLVRTGRRKLAFISGPPQNFAAQERRRGFERGLKAAGLAPEARWISHGEFTAESGRQQTRALLEAEPRPQAIVAANDLLAVGALRACAQLRQHVPENIAIVGFDDIQFAQMVTPSLTTLRQPQEQIARDCVNLLIHRITTGDLGQPRRLTYDLELIARESA